MSKNTIVYVCQTCGELVPLGCCTCGPRQRLTRLPMPGGKEMYIRKVEMFEIRSDDSEITHWRGTREELNALLDDDEWFEHETIVFARLSAVLCSPRTEVKGARCVEPRNPWRELWEEVIGTDCWNNNGCCRFCGMHFSENHGADCLFNRADAMMAEEVR